MEKQSIINLKPIFLNEEVEYIPRLNSLFLYVFLFFQFIVISLLVYYFFQVEIIFLYNKIFYPEAYSEEDKKKYNSYMFALKNIITMNVYCEKEEDKWYPKFGSGRNMLTLDQQKIVFKDEASCKMFINN
ncbi:putative entry-fusion IMV protein [Yalta virus]|nr:putative entry-fusion IMV protein [Yalta virus]